MVKSVFVLINICPLVLKLAKQSLIQPLKISIANNIVSSIISPNFNVFMYFYQLCNNITVMISQLINFWDVLESTIRTLNEELLWTEMIYSIQ